MPTIPAIRGWGRQESQEFRQAWNSQETGTKADNWSNLGWRSVTTLLLLLPKVYCLFTLSLFPWWQRSAITGYFSKICSSWATADLLSTSCSVTNSMRVIKQKTNKQKKIFMCMLACTYVCVYIYYVHAWSPWKPEEGLGSFGTRVGWLWAVVSMLGIKPRSFARTASSPNLWAVVLAPPLQPFLKEYLMPIVFKWNPADLLTGLTYLFMYLWSELGVRAEYFLDKCLSSELHLNLHFTFWDRVTLNYSRWPGYQAL